MNSTWWLFSSWKYLHMLCCKSGEWTTIASWCATVLLSYHQELVLHGIEETKDWAAWAFLISSQILNLSWKRSWPSLAARRKDTRPTGRHTCGCTFTNTVTLLKHRDLTVLDSLLRRQHKHQVKFRGCQISLAWNCYSNWATGIHLKLGHVGSCCRHGSKAPAGIRTWAQKAYSSNDFLSLRALL